MLVTEGAEPPLATFSTSSRVICPEGPVPWTLARSTPSDPANLRTGGIAFTPFDRPSVEEDGAPGGAFAEAPGGTPGASRTATEGASAPADPPAEMDMSTDPTGTTSPAEAWILVTVPA